MRAVLVLLVLALAAGVRAEETSAAAAVQEQNPFPDVPQEQTALAGEDEDVFEDEGEADSEAGAEDASLAEVAAETHANAAAVAAAESESETEAEINADLSAETEEEGKPGFRNFGKGRGGLKKRPIIAPRPIVQPVKFHSERIVAHTTKNEDPEMAKLQLALDAVKEDILSTNKQITDERKWVIAVAKIIASYNDKMKRVESHIVALRKEMKALYRKKKQIENLKLQKALEAKLKEARDELATLTNSLKHVAVKQGELNRSGADLRQTIAGIQAQLAKLRGQQLKKPRPAVKGKRSRKAGRKGGRKGRRGGKARKGRGQKRCKRGFRFSRNAKRCVPKRR